MRKIFILSSLIAICFTLTNISPNLVNADLISDIDIEKIVRTSPKASDYPESDYIILADVHNYSLTTEGYHVNERRLIYKIFTYNGIHAFSETWLDYNQKFQTIQFISSKTWATDGFIVDGEIHGINLLSPSDAVNASAYPNIRENVVSGVGLEKGAVVELHYAIITDKQTLPYLWGDFTLAEQCPILQKQLNIYTPKDTKLIYDLFNNAEEPNSQIIQKAIGPVAVYSWSTDDGKDKSAIREPEVAEYNHYQWNWTDIEPIYHEHHSPDIKDISKRIVFSTCSSWQELADFVNQFLFSGKMWLKGYQTEELSSQLAGRLQNTPYFTKELYLQQYERNYSKENNSIFNKVATNVISPQELASIQQQSADTIQDTIFEIQKKVKFETSASLTDFNIAQKIHNYLIRDYQHFNFNPILAGYQTLPPSIIYRVGHANSWDMTNFMRTLLQVRDIETELAFTAKQNQFSKKVPSLAQFDELWLHFDNENKEMWLHPTKGVMLDQIPNSNTLCYLPNSNPIFVELDNQELDNNLLQLETTIKISSDSDDCNVSGTANYELTGTFNPYNQYNTYDEQKRYIKDYLSAISSKLELDEFHNYTENAKMLLGEAQFSINKWGGKNDENYFVSLNRTFLFDNFIHLNLTDAIRHSDVVFDQLFQELYTINIEIPDDWEVEYLPDNLEISTNNYNISVKYEYHPTNHKLQIIRKFQLKDRIIPVSTYQKFRSDLLQTQTERYNTIIFSNE